MMPPLLNERLLLLDVLLLRAVAIAGAVMGPGYVCTQAAFTERGLTSTWRLRPQPDIAIDGPFVPDLPIWKPFMARR